MVVYKLNKEEAVWWTSQWQGYCPLCGDDTDKPVVDHCHQSEEVRGLICNNCNVALGLIHDSVDTLLNMIEYLE